MDEKIVVRLLALQRHSRCSVNGNPRYRVTTDHGTYDTATDASCNYGIENDWSGKTSRPARITLHRGRIVDVVYLDDCDTVFKALRDGPYSTDFRSTPRSTLVRAHLTLGDIETSTRYLLPSTMVVRHEEGGTCVRVPDNDEPVACAQRAELATVLWSSEDAIQTGFGTERYAYPIRLTSVGHDAMRTLARFLNSAPTTA